MSKYIPDKWLILKITRPEKEDMYKVFGTWRGGYLSADSWRMNSGIVSAQDNAGAIVFLGNSGSEYICNKEQYGTTVYGADIIGQYQEMKGYTISILSEEEALSLDWLNKKEAA